MALQKKVLENILPNCPIFITICQRAAFEAFLEKVKLDFGKSTFLFSGTKLLMNVLKIL